MSFFNRRPIQTKKQNNVNVPVQIGHKSIKYVELFGTLPAGDLGNGISKYVIDYIVPQEHCAELYAIGVQPDINTAGTVSNLKETEICFDNKGTGIKFLTNHLGKNFLPYGDATSIQPIRMLDFPMRPGNLTVKFNEGMRIQIKLTGKGTLQSAVNVRAKVLLYEPQDVRAIYGCDITNFATLPGGVSQSLPVMIFTDYVEDFSTTTRARWEVAYNKQIMDYEEITLTHIGVVPHPNADSLKIFDYRQKWEAPEYEPYWKIKSNINALTFGDDAEYQPTFKLPSVISEHRYNNTNLQVLVRDDGTAQATVSIHLLGVYRRLR